jgi:ribonuclease HII
MFEDSDAEYILGSDEVGAGAWAGPMLICAVLAPRTWVPPAGLRDSKKLTDGQLERFADYGMNDSDLIVVLKEVSSEYIDQIGKQRSLIEAHESALKEGLAFAKGRKTIVVADGNMPIQGALSVIEAEDKVPAVAMASCIAKVKRDRLMWDMSRQYPGYSFESNVGYHSKDHLEALNRLGPCPIHRKSFSPIKKVIRAQESEAAMKLLRLTLDDTV